VLRCHDACQGPPVPQPRQTAHLARPAPRLAALAIPARYRAGTAASSYSAGPKGAPRGIAVQLVLKAPRARRREGIGAIDPVVRRTATDLEKYPAKLEFAGYGRSLLHVCRL